MGIFLGYVWPIFIIINGRVNFMIATYVMKEFKKITFAGSNSKISDFDFEHLLRNKMKYSKKLKAKANFLYILPSLPLKKYFHYSRSLYGFKINLYKSVEVLVRIYLKAQGLSPVASAHGQISRCYSLFRHCKQEILCFKHASQFIGSYLCYQLVLQTITSR